MPHLQSLITAWNRWRSKPSPDRAPVSATQRVPSKEHARDSVSVPDADFDPQVLSKLGSLELIAQTVVEGFLSGKHRSTHKGGCTDFAEFRPYARGDSIRLLDWRHFARTDRYYVKCFEDETNLQGLLVVDASGSMAFGKSTVSKFRYAQMAAATFAHLLLRQRDAVGLAVVSQSAPTYLKPVPSSLQLVKILSLLKDVEPSGQTTLPQTITELAGRLRRRGLVIVFSDCFGNVAELKRSLQLLRSRGHDVLVVQSLAPEEVTFPFTRDAVFQDLEHLGRMQIRPTVLRKRYLEAFQAFMNELRAAFVSIGVDLLTLDTSHDLGDALAFYLHRRAATRRMTASSSRH